MSINIAGPRKAFTPQVWCCVACGQGSTVLNICFWFLFVFSDESGVPVWHTEDFTYSAAPAPKWTKQLQASLPITSISYCLSMYDLLSYLYMLSVSMYYRLLRTATSLSHQCTFSLEFWIVPYFWLSNFVLFCVTFQCNSCSQGISLSWFSLDECTNSQTRAWGIICMNYVCSTSSKKEFLQH